MYLPGTLSRAYLPDTPNPEITDQEPVSTLDFLSITEDKYTDFVKNTALPTRVRDPTFPVPMVSSKEQCRE